MVQFWGWMTPSDLAYNTARRQLDFRDILREGRFVDKVFETDMRKMMSRLGSHKTGLIIV